MANDKQLMKRVRQGRVPNMVTPVGMMGKEPLILPNHSGDHTAGHTKAPIKDIDLVNKKYVDDEIVDNAWLKTVGQTGLTGDKTGSFDLTTSGVFDVNEVFNSDANLKLEPGCQYDVTLFEDADIPDNTDGKKFYLYRKSNDERGDKYAVQYINQYGSYVFDSTGNCNFNSDGYLRLNPNQRIFIDNGGSSYEINIRKDQGVGNVNIVTIENDGEFKLELDSQYLYFGAGQDARFYYDGTDMKLDTDVVAASDFVIDCGTDKTLELTEPVYKDINMGSGQFALPASSYPSMTQFKDEEGLGTGIYGLGFDTGEAVYGAVEVQHDYKEGGTITPHVHFYTDGTSTNGDTDNVKWGLRLNIIRDGYEWSEIITGTTVLTGTGTIYNGEVYYGQRVDLTALSGEDIKIGDQIVFKLYRDNAASDEYPGALILETFGFHYEVNTLGSRTIGTK